MHSLVSDVSAGGDCRLGFLSSFPPSSVFHSLCSLDRERLQHGPVLEWLHGKNQNFSLAFSSLCAVSPPTPQPSLSSLITILFVLSFLHCFFFPPSSSVRDLSPLHSFLLLSRLFSSSLSPFVAPPSTFPSFTIFRSLIYLFI